MESMCDVRYARCDVTKPSPRCFDIAHGRSPIAHGFTLLEMLLAMAVTAAVVAAVYGTLATSVRARDATVAAVGQDRDVRQATGMIRRDLQAVPRPTGIMAGSFLGTDNADRDEVSYTTSNAYRPTPDRMADLISVTLKLVDDPDPSAGIDDGATLVREVTTNLLASETPEPTTQVLLRGVEGFDVRYSTGGDWTDTYDSTQQDNQLPLAVEVTLTLAEAAPDGDGFTDEPLTRRIIIALPAGRDGGSAFGFGGLR